VVTGYTDQNLAGAADGNALLDDHEMIQIAIGCTQSGDTDQVGSLVNALATDCYTNTDSTIDVMTSQGSVLVFERKTPTCINSALHLN